MGTTTNLALPYPEGSDFVIDGDDAIQALAEALDDYHSQSAKLVRSATQTFADATLAAVQWTNASSTLTSDFDLVTTSAADDTLKYLGPPRFVAWRFGLDFPSGLATGNAEFSFQRQGSVTDGQDDFVWGFRDFTEQSGSRPLGNSGLVYMATNSEWQVFVLQTTGASRAVSAFASFKAL